MTLITRPELMDRPWVALVWYLLYLGKSMELTQFLLDTKYWIGTNWSKLVLKIRSKNKDFFFILTNSKSKVQVSDSITNYFVWVQKKCIKQLCTKLKTVIGQKPYSTFKSTPHWLKRRSARPSTHTIAHLKGGVKVLDPLTSFIMACDICWAIQRTIFGTKMPIYKLRNT